MADTAQPTPKDKPGTPAPVTPPEAPAGKPAYLLSTEELRAQVLAISDKELETLKAKLDEFVAAHPEFDGKRHAAWDAEKAKITEAYQKLRDEHLKQYPQPWIPNPTEQQKADSATGKGTVGARATEASRIHQNIADRNIEELKNCCAKHFPQSKENHDKKRRIVFSAGMFKAGLQLKNNGLVYEHAELGKMLDALQDLPDIAGSRFMKSVRIMLRNACTGGYACDAYEIVRTLLAKGEPFPADENRPLLQGMPKLDATDKPGDSELYSEPKSLKEWATDFKKHENTLRRWFKNGQIKARKAGKYWRVAKSELP